MSLHIWAISHGVATLFAQGGARKVPMSPEEILESAMLIYLKGLGILHPTIKPAGPLIRLPTPPPPPPHPPPPSPLLPPPPPLPPPSGRLAAISARGPNRLACR